MVLPKTHVVLEDGSKIDTKFGEIEKKVREINGEQFLPRPTDSKIRTIL